MLYEAAERIGRSASELDQQLHDTFGSCLLNRRVDTACEALGGFARQTVTARRAADRDRLEPGGFDEHVLGRVGDLGRGTAHDTGDADGAGLIGDEQVLCVKLTHLVVEGRERLASLCTAHGDAAGELIEVVGVNRLTELEHHVVRDVNGDRNGAHPGKRQSLRHPGRSRRVRIDAAHGTGDEPRAADASADRRIVSERDREAVACAGLDQSGIGEGRARGVRVLACDASHAEGVAAVGRDSDLYRDLVEAEQGLRVIAGSRVVAHRVESHDAVVVAAEADLARGGHHAVGDVSVGLARRDLEPPGQHGAGQCRGNKVADLEVLGAADDAARLCLADVDLHPANRLAVLLRLLFEAEHSADRQRSTNVAAVNRLVFQADVHEGFEHVLGSRVLQLDVFCEPIKRNPHQITIPNCCENRTSPSIMSRMSESW